MYMWTQLPSPPIIIDYVSPTIEDLIEEMSRGEDTEINNPTEKTPQKNTIPGHAKRIHRKFILSYD